MTARTIVGALVVLVAFFAIDAAYLAAIGGKLFKATLGDVLAPTVVIPAAVAFYMLFPIGLTIFALLPALADGRWSTALVNGALFGFFAYATYDLTNFATIRNWTATLTLIDLCWGAFLSGVASLIGFYAVRAIYGLA